MLMSAGPIIKMQDSKMTGPARRLVYYPGSRSKIDMLVFAYLNLIAETDIVSLEDIDNPFESGVKDQGDADMGAGEYIYD
jgi:hypothetical protein